VHLVPARVTLLHACWCLRLLLLVVISACLFSGSTQQQQHQRVLGSCGRQGRWSTNCLSGFQVLASLQLSLLLLSWLLADSIISTCTALSAQQASVLVRSLCSLAAGASHGRASGRPRSRRRGHGSVSVEVSLTAFDDEDAAASRGGLVAQVLLADLSAQALL
jgi:hypothetical protein